MNQGSVLPPGAANVEDDVRAWEAQERRDKWKLMTVRVVLAIVLLSVWEYGTDRWFDALWFSSPLRVARHQLVVPLPLGAVVMFDQTQPDRCRFVLRA